MAITARLFIVQLSHCTQNGAKWTENIKWLRGDFLGTREKHRGVVTENINGLRTPTFNLLKWIIWKYRIKYK
jgi:hypothetical protein